MTISSMGGIPDDEEPAQVARRLGTRELVLVILQTVARLVVGFAFIFWLMSLAPQTPEDSLFYPVLLAVLGVTIYVVFFIRQLRGVYKARFPTLRAVEALILTATMFLAIFAMTYVSISIDTADAFTEQLTGFSSYYYALTVLATVGFGDIAPVSVPARSVTMVQMALDIAFIAVLIRIMGGAAKKALQQRAHEAARQSTTTK
jgi:voltage-gated potassium channel